MELYVAEVGDMESLKECLCGGYWGYEGQFLSLMSTVGWGSMEFCCVLRGRVGVGGIEG
jgi:hypothetical protein